MRSIVPTLVILVLIAGCSGVTPPTTTTNTSPPPVTDGAPTTHPEATTSPGDSPTTATFTIQTGKFRFDYERTGSRVAMLTNTTVPPTKVSVITLSAGTKQRCAQSTLYERLAVQCDASGASTLAYGSVDPRTQSITIRVDEVATVQHVEALFVHEIGHVLQYKRGVTYGQIIQGTKLTTEEKNTARALIEGHAEFIERAYERKYHSQVRPDARWRYENRSGSQSAGVYYIGAMYFETTTASVAGSWEQFDSPPTTTEQILHPNSSPGVPKPLRIAIDESIVVESRNTQGELAIKNALRSRLSDEVSNTAAAGWGNDSVVHIRTDDGKQGTVWVTRWDTTTDAQEFAKSMEAYQAALSEQRQADIQVLREGDIVIVEIGLPSSIVVEAQGEGKVSVRTR